MRTTSENHLIENANASDFVLEEEDINLITKSFPISFCQIPVNNIDISDNGEWNHKAYKTITEAKENKLGYAPSPVELAKSIKKSAYLKPVRLKRLLNVNKKYVLVGGRIRYWAWRIAHEKDCPDIPAYIRKDYNT